MFSLNFLFFFAFLICFSFQRSLKFLVSVLPQCVCFCKCGCLCFWVCVPVTLCVRVCLCISIMLMCPWLRLGTTQCCLSAHVNAKPTQIKHEDVFLNVCMQWVRELSACVCVCVDSLSLHYYTCTPVAATKSHTEMVDAGTMTKWVALACSVGGVACASNQSWLIEKFVELEYVRKTKMVSIFWCLDLCVSGRDCADTTEELCRGR